MFCLTIELLSGQPWIVLLHGLCWKRWQQQNFGGEGLLDDFFYYVISLYRHRNDVHIDSWFIYLFLQARECGVKVCYQQSDKPTGNCHACTRHRMNIEHHYHPHFVIREMRCVDHWDRALSCDKTWRSKPLHGRPPAGEVRFLNNLLQAHFFKQILFP